MGFREMIKKVQIYSGFSDAESKEALEMMVESLAERLTNGERKDFASQLPQELKEIALAAETAEGPERRDMIHEFMDKEQIDESRAKKQIMCAWKAIKESISPGEIADIRSQLPNNLVAMLH